MFIVADNGVARQNNECVGEQQQGQLGDNCEFQWEKLPRQAVGVSQGKLYPSYNSLLDIQSLRCWIFLGD